MTIRRALPLLVTVLLLASLAGCTTGNPAIVPPPVNPISVLFLGAPPSSLAINASATFSAGIANGTSTTSDVLTWSVTCSSPGACGSFSATTALGGSPVTYTAPSAIPTGNTVTITATAVADTTKSVSATVTIVPPIPISVAFFATVPASIEVGASIPLSALITNDVTANPKVQWTVTCGASACGSFNPVDTFSEAQTTYTAPTAIPLGGTVTVTATSVTDPTKSASASIIITAAGPTLANGTYVFQLAGPSGYNASFTTGAFVAQNGTITGGEQDSVYYLSDSDGNSSAYNTPQQISGGSYTTTAAGNLQLNLTIGPGETETLNGILTSGSQGFAAQLYGAPGSGSLALQTTVAAPAGGYAFATYGGDRSSQTALLGGILNIDSPGKISGSGSVIDVNDGTSSTSGEETIGASTVSAPDKYGRVQIQLLPGSASILPSLYLAGYIVDATHIFLIETGGDNFLGVQGGQALGQGTNTGTFTTASFANSSYVFAASQIDLQVAGVFTAATNGSLSGVLNHSNLSGTGAQSPISFTGSFTIDPTGRATLSNITDGSTFNYSFHLYLTGNGSGLLMNSGLSNQLIGQAFQQTTPFTTASFSGAYGWNTSQTTSSYAATPLLATVTSSPNSTTDALAGFAVANGRVADFSFTGDLTALANGAFTGTLTGLNTKSPTMANAFTFYLIDNTHAVAIETDTTQLTLGYLAHQ